MKVAASMQITAKGQPIIYYGEELGQTGANNYPYQTNRYDLDWNIANDSNDMLTHYKTMLGIRQAYSEILAEGDITRFLAMYQSEEPDEVGPVRSAREYYFNLADDYNAVYVYHGAAKFVNKMIKDEHIEYINGAQHDNDGTLFKRSTDRQAPHNSYVQFGALEKEMKAAGYDTKADYESLPFKKKDSEVDGEAATNIQVKYSANSDAYNPVYSYQKDQNIYTRSAADEQTIENSDSTPIEVTNLFVIEAPHEVFDDEGRRKIDLDNGGDAYLFQGGKQKKVKWEKKDGYIIPTEDGKPVGFLPGKTWVNVVPENPGLAQAVEVFNE